MDFGVRVCGPLLQRTTESSQSFTSFPGRKLCNPVEFASIFACKCLRCVILLHDRLLFRRRTFQARKIFATANLRCDFPTTSWESSRRATALDFFRFPIKELTLTSPINYTIRSGRLLRSPRPLFSTFRHWTFP
jgi:hypothetical protein